MNHAQHFTIAEEEEKSLGQVAMRDCRRQALGDTAQAAVADRRGPQAASGQFGKSQYPKRGAQMKRQRGVPSTRQRGGADLVLKDCPAWVLERLSSAARQRALGTAADIALLLIIARLTRGSIDHDLRGTRGSQTAMADRERCADGCGISLGLKAGSEPQGSGYKTKV
jgi:hypothetical protein